MDLYHKAGFGASKLFTRLYSTSFSLGILAFAPKYRDPIYAVYGYVRLADEIVDSFHGYEKEKLLKKFRADTYEALSDGISTNPIIHSFVQTVKKYKIDMPYIDAFLDSMEMDLYNSTYGRKAYDNYIYGSAEVVGLMCLRVFVEGDDKLFDALLSPARALGSAFQKVNFLRDIKSDIEERGRIYLPGIASDVQITDESKQKLEDEVEAEFLHALEGIRQLPGGVRLGVYSAFLYYYKLFEKIKQSPVKTLMHNRVRVSNTHKFALFVKSAVEVKVLRTC